jgi:hypothetical protein
MTEQQREFVRIWLQGGQTTVDVFRRVYPPKNGPRSPNGERVQAYRILHSAPVQKAIEGKRPVNRTSRRIST